MCRKSEGSKLNVFLSPTTMDQTPKVERSEATLDHKKLIAKFLTKKIVETASPISSKSRFMSKFVQYTKSIYRDDF